MIHTALCFHELLPFIHEIPHLSEFAIAGVCVSSGHISIFFKNLDQWLRIPFSRGFFILALVAIFL